MRRASIVAALAVVIVFSLYAAVLFLSRTELARQQAQHVLASVGLEADLEEFKIDYDFTIRIRNMKVGEAGREPFVAAEHLAIALSPVGLLRGQPLRVCLGAPRLFLAHLPTRRPADSGSRTGSFPFHAVEIDNGYVVVASGEMLGPLSLSLKAVEMDRIVRLALEVDPKVPLLEVTSSVRLADGELVIEDLQARWSAVPLAPLVERHPGLLPSSLQGVVNVSVSASGPLRRLTGTASLETLQVAMAVSGFDVTVPRGVVAGSFQSDFRTTSFKGHLSASGVGVRDATFERAAENLSVEGALESRWSREEPLQLDLDLKATSGETLWRRIYADLTNHPVKIRAAAARRTTGAIALSQLAVNSKGLGSLTGQARLGPSMGFERFAVEIDIPDLDSVYGLTVREALRESYAFLAESALRGRLRLAGEFRRTKAGAGFAGEVRLAEGTLSSTAPEIEIDGIEVEMPLRLGEVTSAAVPGYIRVAGIRFGELQLPPLATRLRVEPNRIVLSEPIALQTLGGVLKLSKLEATAPDGRQWRIRLSFAVEDLGLPALTAALGWAPLSGTVSGSIPELTLDTERIWSAGEIRIEAFGGHVVIANLRVEQLFSAIPTLMLDVSFDGISLARLTETLEVGSISGVVRGAVRDLAVVNGQPSSFDAWLETVPQRDVPQRVSVDAIRQLSILGGAGGDPLSQGILGFFDEYRYARMGFRCRLENDRFFLRGVEQIDGKDYLVVGARLPPRVDVISHSQEISFSEMVRRLQRIGAGGRVQRNGGER